MGVFDDGYTQALIDAARNPIARPPAGFSESFAATWQATRQEDLSISERQNFLDKVHHRDQLIIDKTGGYLTNEAAPDPFGALDLNDPTLVQPGQLGTTVERARLAYNKRIGELSAQHPEIKTDEDLLVEIKADSKRIREETGKVLENTTFAGKIGSFTGAMAASTTDPLVLATIPLGASASAGLLRTALVNAGIGGLTEAMIQPFVYHYKKTLDSPYSFSEAAQRVAEAGIGAAALSSVVKGAELGYARLRRPRLPVDELLDAFDKHVPNPAPIEQDAAHVLGEYADTMRETPFELGNPAADQAHLNATAKALGDLDAGHPVDVQAFTMGLDPRPELAQEAENLRIKIVKESKPPTPATVDQSLNQFVKNSGGVAINKAGDLRGEYQALYESGGRRSGSVKRDAGLSADEMAQRAHEAGFIEEPDPVVLAEALRNDMEGKKVFTPQGDRFERKIDLDAERQYNAWAQMQEEAYHQELAAKANSVLQEADVQIPTGDVIEKDGQIHPVTRSAREVLHEADQDLKMGEILRNCLIGGAGE